VLSITGTPEAPSKAGIPVADIAAGMYAFSGILAALVERGRTGRGRVVDVSLFDSLTEWMGFPMYWTAYSGTPPARRGAEHPGIAPYGPIPVADGEIVLAIQNDREWRVLAEQVLGRPELGTDPRFATNTDRVANRAVLHAVIDEVLAALPGEEVARRLHAARIANGRRNEVAGLLDHPQLAQRDRWRTVDSPVGELDALLPPITMPGVTPRMDPVPELGAHTDDILTSLGYDAEGIARLRREGVL
jgi:crotonobetainyl-CoA:carnitine CoA-transferase CaiB-like acyl-CoA transferase